MKRVVLAVLATAFAVSCSDITAPNPALQASNGPSFASQQGPSDTECGGTFEPEIITGPATFQNIIVPEGMICVLIDVTVSGNIKALAGSDLAVGSSEIAGNIQGDKVRGVTVGNSSVGGSIDIVDGIGGSINNFDYEVSSATITRNIHILKSEGELKVSGNLVQTGNIKVEDNLIDGLGMFVTGNNVGGNLQVFKNKGGGDGKSVQGNIVRQNIQCYENEQPFVGNPNTTPRPEQQERQCGVPPTLQ